MSVVICQPHAASSNTVACDGSESIGRNKQTTMSDRGSDGDSVEGGGGPSVPRGAVGYYHHHHRKQERSSGAVGAWEGDDLERDRDREHREATHSGQGAVAVDLEQFRNYQVGTGYQARGVVRQRTATAATPNSTAIGKEGAGIASNAASTAVDRKQHQDEKPTKHKKSKKRKGKGTEEDDDLLEYLRCDAFRVFRKELESMLENP